MNIDLPAAVAFMATHARVLDRRRFQLLLKESEPSAVLAALGAYRNPDGGYGCGLEPDLRSAPSQPAAALHAFEVFADIAPATTPRAVELCDWLASVSLPDGGLPFALPLADGAGCAPFWAHADPTLTSLQITAVVAAPHALELTFAMQFLDAVHDTRPEAAGILHRLAKHIPASGLLHVGGGTDEEFIRPLDFAPDPDRPVRKLFTHEAVTDELQRLLGQQQDDGGWPVDFENYSPAAVLEWRGYMTVRAVSILLRNSIIGLPQQRSSSRH